MKSAKIVVTDDPLNYDSEKVTKCFRFSTKAMIDLKSEAERKEISLNSLVNTLIMSYLKWGRFLERHGGLSFMEASFAALVNEIDDPSIFERAGREAGLRTPRRLLLMLGLPINRKKVLQVFDLICEFSLSYRFSHKIINNEDHFLLTHNLSRKWSVWFSAYVQSMFEDLLGIEVSVKADDDSISFSV